MAVTVDELHAEVSPEPSDGTPAPGKPAKAGPPDMDSIRIELRRDADRLARLWTD